MNWTQYNAMIEAGEESACINHRKSFGLIGLPDEDGIDCNELPCSKGCPFLTPKKIRDGAVIKIHPETRDRLKNAGKKGETYDKVINRLIDNPCTLCDNSGKYGPRNPKRCSNCQDWYDYIRAL